jgi:hypothetical protein
VKQLLDVLTNEKSFKTISPEEIEFKDGVLSAFEHHCAGCHNLPFTAFILITIGANLLRIYY